MSAPDLMLMVRQLADRLNEILTSRLYAKCSAKGPRDIDDVIRLMRAQGMDAAMWVLEAYVEQMEDSKSYDEVASELEDAEEKLKSINEIINPEGVD